MWLSIMSNGCRSLCINVPRISLCWGSTNEMNGSDRCHPSLAAFSQWTPVDICRELFISAWRATHNEDVECYAGDLEGLYVCISLWVGKQENTYDIGKRIGCVVIIHANNECHEYHRSIHSSRLCNNSNESTELKLVSGVWILVFCTVFNILMFHSPYSPD